MPSKSVTGSHWSQVASDDAKLVTHKGMETPRFSQVVIGLLGESCQQLGSLKV